MITSYQSMRGPAYDEDCGCHCNAERNLFQSALDEIAALLDGVTATTITDEILDQVRAEADKR